MPFVWLVECKTCLQRFAIKPRSLALDKSTRAVTPGTEAGSFECPHCHEVHEYSAEDYIPGEGRLHST